MSKVYFLKFNEKLSTDNVSEAAKILLEKYVNEENVKIEGDIPLKVHFGEEGNTTYIKAENYFGVVEYLQNLGANLSYIETNVVYEGARQRRDVHIETAKRHGFTNLPIVIADGEAGEEFTRVRIDKKHFKECYVGKEYSKYNKIMVMSHFKGHTMAGFGGAIKQLGMGFASRGGKLAQHVNAKPFVRKSNCIGCGVCASHCPEDAIKIINKKANIDKAKCIGCGACLVSCPKKTIKVNYLSALSGSFVERLSEYAYAADLGKKNIYMSFAMDITRGCDCEGHSMKPFIDDVGIFISKDPVAIDQACIDVIRKINGKKLFRRGHKALRHAEKIGLGSRDYELIELV